VDQKVSIVARRLVSTLLLVEELESPGEARALEPGMVFHVPVNIRLWGQAFVAASETILVTPTGREVERTRMRTARTQNSEGHRTEAGDTPLSSRKTSWKSRG